MYFDTHSHLTLCHHLSLEEQFSLFRSVGVTQVLDPGLWVDDFKDRYEALSGYPEVMLGIALAPHSLEKHRRDHSNGLNIYLKGCLDRLEDFLRQKKKYRINALSEIGLDFFYHQDKCNHRQQEELFLHQLALAQKYDLPVFLHIRSAYKRTLELVRRSGVDRGAVHCFTGTLEEARKFLDLGFYLSFSGIVTFKNAQDLQQVATYVPEDRMLSETDSPYLAPHPLRGKKNNSSYIVYINQFLGDLKQIELKKINMTLVRNAERLLNLNPD